jgi:inorganic pyrophosphatase
MNPQKLPVGEKYPEIINTFIEIPKGNRNKYEYDEELGCMKLDRTLYSAMYYPVDYGFIPQTRDEDGDALDALVLTDSPVFAGCVVEARVLGLLKMVDGGEVDDKILCVPTGNPHFDHIQSMDDVAPHMLKEIANFFETYKILQKKETKIEGWFSKEEAIEVIKKCYKVEQQNTASA